MTRTRPKPSAQARPRKAAGRKTRKRQESRTPDVIEEAIASLTANPAYRWWTAHRLRAAVLDAIRVHGADDPSEADTLEAWLLTGVSFNEVAAKTGLPVDVVTVYAALYCDVARRLGTDHDREELAWELFGSRGLYGFPEADTRNWKRYLGLAGGEHVLAGYLDYLKACPLVVPADLTTLSEAELQRLVMFFYTRILTLGDTSDWTDAQKRRFEAVVVRRESLGV
jgi:hypothetical protein